MHLSTTHRSLDTHACCCCFCCCVFIRDAGLWARFVIASVALIYTARLSVYALSHTLERPQAFNAFNMPKWWDSYRIIGGWVGCTFPRGCWLNNYNCIVLFGWSALGYRTRGDPTLAAVRKGLGRVHCCAFGKSLQLLVYASPFAVDHAACHSSSGRKLRAREGAHVGYQDETPPAICFVIYFVIYFVSVLMVAPIRSTNHRAHILERLLQPVSPHHCN